MTRRIKEKAQIVAQSIESACDQFATGAMSYEHAFEWCCAALELASADSPLVAAEVDRIMRDQDLEMMGKMRKLVIADEKREAQDARDHEQTMASMMREREE